MSKKGAKAAQSTKETVSYDVRDIVLAKVRGFPPWPGMVSCFSQKRVNYWPCYFHKRVTRLCFLDRRP